MREEDKILDSDDEDDQKRDFTATNDASQRIYTKACVLFKVTPSTFLYRHLTTMKVPLQNHAIGDAGAKAMATALVENKKVQIVDLSSTGITAVGLGYILEMLEENTSITDINLSSNFFNSTGAKQISDAFTYNQTVKKLNISGNEFKDEDSRCLAEIIEENITLQVLIISRNAFGETAGTNFGKALEHNTTLIHFDISWNHLRQQGAIELCHGLQNNNTLEVLNLSWNGFGLEGCHEMGKTLKINRSLTDLDLSSNRVNYDAFKLLLRGLVKNKTLKTIKIGFNPITTDGAMSILRAVLDDRCKSLTTLDMSDVSVDNDFVTLLKKVQHIRPLHITHGNLLRHDDLRKGDNPVVLDTDDPVTILFECVKTKNLRLIDLMKNLDKDNSDTLSREELNRGLSEIDVPLSRRSLDILMEKLDMNKDGQVDFMELMTKYKEHVRRVTKLQREADVDLKHYKHFDKLEQLREMVRLRLSLTPAAGQSH
ncbi:leucine-rich repeat-containing protein 74B-like isoform X2 [Mercenaria mercenaria]|uniref:leucine-rich repeat-containing protein 74B-like isoform X2 n=1 Tax=Mercenaria mercenaria TaxID=6596 RepID=UPI00234F7765|nr:leucine-rich repeat-containing protein 74B-like isoform X2 [Mercenaria mercenaria]